MFTPTYVALSRGYFKDAGLDVQMNTAQGNDKTMSALLTGSTDIVLLGPEAVIYVANSESPQKPQIIASLVAHGGFLLVDRNVKATPATFKWDDLKGKTVMAYRPGSTPDVFLDTLLRRHHLAIGKDLKIVNNIGVTARMGAWIAGQADYGIFAEPEASTIERQGNGKVVASVGHEIGPVDYTIFAAMAPYIQKHPKVINAWYDAIARAEKEVAAESPQALAKEVAPFFPGLSQPDLVASLTRYRHYNIWKTTPTISKSAISAVQDMLIAEKLMKPDQRVSYDRVVAPELAKRSQ
ncbi:MAG: ABC transporter substrate-binding protein [Candidimonas sp.]|nr:MAG: ABC transporter substrate-binding protein [Candidimonas sp.]